MAKLAFYQQARVDGGMRSGVDRDDTPLLHEFHEGSGEQDPALLWYVDVEFEGDALPNDAEAARRWLVRRAASVAAALGQLADDLALGVDIASRPLKRSIEGLPQDVLGTISCSAVRRMDCRQIAERLRNLAAQWRQIIRRLPQMREAA
ncbi:MAG: hypothetical protein ACREHD_33090 [Pirellulales bacterium]